MEGAAGDQALALVFYTGIALGVVLVAQAGALNVDLFQYLFGSILTVTRSDLVTIALLGGLGLATVGLLYRAFAAVVIDEEGARVAGVPIGTLNIALAALTAVTVALSMRVVGILLVAALMVLPVSAAGRLARSMRSTLVLSIAIGLGSAILGLTISYYADLPPGGTIVLVAAAGYLVALARDGPNALGGDERRDARLVAAAAACFVLLRSADDDGLAGVRRGPAVDEPLGGRGRATAAVADGLQLVDELGMRQELGHRTEGKSPEVLVEPRHDDADSAIGQLERVLDDRRLEELHLVDPDDLEPLCTLEDVVHGRHRNSAHARAGMAHDVGRVVAVVDPRLEDDDALAGDLGAAQPADHLLALPAEHRTADHLEPAASLRGDADHGGDPSTAIGGHRQREEGAPTPATLSPARRRSSVG